MKRLLIIGISVLVVIICIGVFFYFRHQNASTPDTSPTSEGLPSTFPNPALSEQPSPTPYSIPIPTGDTVQIQTASGVVETKNFYKTAVYTGDAFVFFETFGDKDYHIQYNRQDSSFVVQLIADTREKARKVREAAQSELLDKLGVDKTTACKLNTHVLAPREFPMAVQDLEDYGLSFCPDGKPL